MAIPRNGFIRCAATGLCLDVPVDIPTGAKITQQWFSRNWTQFWHFTPRGEAAVPGRFGGQTFPCFVIETQHGGKCIDVPSGTMSATSLQLYPTNLGSNQLWVFVPVNEGDQVGVFHHIFCKQTGLCFDMPNGAFIPGLPVSQFPFNGGSNQWWNISE